ncbi:MAG: carboxypeptidase-like regulatory domain-containing protein [bacterium]
MRDASTGGPIPGAYIFCFGPTPGMSLSDVQGTYTLSNLTPGSYRVLAYKAGYVPQAKNCTVLEGSTTIVNFLLIKRRILVEDDLLALFIGLLEDEYNARIAYSIVSSIDDPYNIPIDNQL